MCSERQATANKLNAQKSTGPKTAEGKNKASQNAVTHGLTSHRPVLDNEDTAEFRKYVNELIDQLDPTNPWEFVFAKRASCQAWRIQRALCYETLALDNLVKSAQDNDKTNPLSQLSAQKSTSKNAKTKNKPNSGGTAKHLVASKQREDGSLTVDLQDDPDSQKSLLGQAIVDDFRNHWTLDKLARYESRIENSMIRCLDKFKKVRETQMMNFTSLRHYYRGFTRRPQDFQDESNTQARNVSDGITQAQSVSDGINSSLPVTSAPMDSLHNETVKTNPNVAQPAAKLSPSAVLPTSADSFDKTNPISALSAQKPALDTEKTKNEPNSVPVQAPSVSAGISAEQVDIDSAPQFVDASDVPLYDQQKAALINDDFDSFSQWADLKGHAYGYDDESLEPHCPNPPSTGEYLYVENWQHELLRMVNYPWDKRKNLTKAQLNELVDTILCGMSDPVQFLWDFGLIELTAEAAGKRSLAAQTQEQVPALAC